MTLKIINFLQVIRQITWSCGSSSSCSFAALQLHPSTTNARYFFCLLYIYYTNEYLKNRYNTGRRRGRRGTAGHHPVWHSTTSRRWRMGLNEWNSTDGTWYVFFNFLFCQLIICYQITDDNEWPPPNITLTHQHPDSERDSRWRMDLNGWNSTDGARAPTWYVFLVTFSPLFYQFIICYQLTDDNECPPPTSQKPGQPMGLETQTRLEPPPGMFILNYFFSLFYKLIVCYQITDDNK